MVITVPWTFTLYEPLAARPVTSTVCTPVGTDKVVPANDAVAAHREVNCGSAEHRAIEAGAAGALEVSSGCHRRTGVGSLQHVQEAFVGGPGQVFDR